METLFYIVCNIMHLVVLYSYVNKVLIRRYSKKAVIAMWVATFVIDEIVIYFNRLEFVNFLTMFVLFMGLFLIGYKSGTKKACITFLFYCVFTLVSEMSTMCIFTIVGINPQEKYMLGSAISKIFMIVIVRIVLVIIHNRKIMDMPLRLWLCILLIPLCSVAIALILDVNIGIESNEVINIVMLILMMLINYVAFYMFDDLLQLMVLKGQNELLNQQREYYHNQCIQVHGLWEDMREFRHDIKNRYLHEKILLESKDYAELEKCYNNNLAFVSADRLYAKSGNVYIDSIINYKLTIIKQLGADIKCKLRIPPSFDSKYSDITIVLGNLMDNAIEALGNIKNINRVIKVDLIYDDSNLAICIENSYEGKVNKSKGGRFVTGKLDKETHGIGLRSVSKIVEGYGGVLDIKVSENRFMVLVCIPIK